MKVSGINTMFILKWRCLLFLIVVNMSWWCRWGCWLSWRFGTSAWNAAFYRSCPQLLCVVSWSYSNLISMSDVLWNSLYNFFSNVWILTYLIHIRYFMKQSTFTLHLIIKCSTDIVWSLFSDHAKTTQNVCCFWRSSEFNAYRHVWRRDWMWPLSRFEHRWEGDFKIVS